MNAEQRKSNTVEQDGFIIDTDSGEVLGLAIKEFHVTDEATADWVLKKLTESEAEIIKLDLMLGSVAKRLGAERKVAERKVAWLTQRFGSEIEQFAKENLPKDKKTWKGTWGEVAFRTTTARLDVVDEPKAIEWAEKASPEAVKVIKKLNKSEVHGVDYELMLADPYLAEIRGFKVVPAGESVTIKTVKP